MMPISDNSYSQMLLQIIPHQSLTRFALGRYSHWLRHVICLKMHLFTSGNVGYMIRPATQTDGLDTKYEVAVPYVVSPPGDLK